MIVLIIFFFLLIYIDPTQAKLPPVPNNGYDKSNVDASSSNNMLSIRPITELRYLHQEREQQQNDVSIPLHGYEQQVNKIPDHLQLELIKLRCTLQEWILRASVAVFGREGTGREGEEPD